jgi:hypothetical protein
MNYKLQRDALKEENKVIKKQLQEHHSKIKSLRE